ncbi:MAG: GTPase Era [Micrococcales bacterium 73-13]|nr:MAG: GTPase Era [Micrococcales bacterium 73-13]
MSPGRAGFVSFVGRPNAGKSTLTNALVGEKVAITSAKPQTTRRAIRGILHRPDGQLVIVDTPGVHRPRTLLGERLNDLVESTLADVDVIAFCVPADERIGPGDRFIVEQLARYPRARKVAVVTKTDKASRARVAEQLVAVAGLCDWDEIVPVSALADEQVGVLADALIALMPESEPLYPVDAVTDETDEDRIAELIREAALEGVQDELPHSLAVTVDEIAPRPAAEAAEGGSKGPITDVYANVWVERDSQKGIVIGRRGARLAEIGARARPGIEALLGTRVYLSLRVKVAKEWQRDPKQLGRLGF